MFPLSSIDLIKQLFYNQSMDMFVALADPTRRAILELLASSGELKEEQARSYLREKGNTSWQAIPMKEKAA
ncbi:hypothetical protein KTT_55090 [Tengunoibacter tsumagoiensis]|uniref:Uncharacterized protein n=1 Tax=Tengunoibacter tsumagoiensis TaxID=2014871 RepID=A0A402A921_9CHLR|nr:hypothetical protein KTT_55090 [Tengunoibacter tsumagoiensis]